MTVIHDVVVMIMFCHVVLMMRGCGNVCVIIIIKKNMKKDKKNMSIWCIYRQGSIRVNKCSHHM